MARAAREPYALVLTICFGCESACGLVAYVDKAAGRIAKLEGNPIHLDSRAVRTDRSAS